MLINSWPAAFDRFIFFRDVVVNVALYVPAGLTGNLAFRKFGRMWLSVAAPVLICTVWSASIEMVQLFVPTRTTSALDLATNVIGAMIGVVAGIVLEDVLVLRRARVHARATTRADEDNRSLGRCAVVVLAKLALVFRCSPSLAVRCCGIKPIFFCMRHICAISALRLGNAGLGGCWKSLAGGGRAASAGRGGGAVAISVVLRCLCRYSLWIASRLQRHSREPLRAFSFFPFYGHFAKPTAMRTGKLRHGRFWRRLCFAGWRLFIFQSRGCSL